MKKLFLLLTVFGFCSAGFTQSFLYKGSSLGAYALNQQGIAFLAAGDLQAALDQFSKALVEDPFSAELQLNLGYVFNLMQKPEQALQAYQAALKTTDDPNLKFNSHFNRAELLGRSGKLDEALSEYQQALEYQPGSTEVKTNIELLIQQQQQQNQKGESQDQKQEGDQKDKDSGDQKDQQGDKEKEDQKKSYGKNKPQPKKFKSEELSPADVNKILGELKRQEDKIRSEYNKREVKEKPHGKDW